MRIWPSGTAGSIGRCRPPPWLTLASLAYRIAKFPAAALAAIKERVNAIALAPADEYRRDSDLFLERARSPEGQSRMKAAVPRGFQTRSGELELARLVADLD
jgi:hypothetical protein